MVYLLVVVTLHVCDDNLMDCALSVAMGQCSSGHSLVKEPLVLLLKIPSLRIFGLLHTIIYAIVPFTN